MKKYIRTERWTREDADGVLLVDVTENEAVIVSVELLHRMLTELGWKRHEHEWTFNETHLEMVCACGAERQSWLRGES